MTAPGTNTKKPLQTQRLLIVQDGTTRDTAYSTVTDFARLRGLSTSVPRASAV